MSASTWPELLPMCPQIKSLHALRKRKRTMSKMWISTCRRRMLLMTTGRAMWRRQGRIQKRDREPFLTTTQLTGVIC